MPLDVWPQALPQAFKVDGFGESLADNVITDGYNVGPPQYRRRTTAAPAKYAGMMAMTTDEWISLQSFFHTTLFDGALRFLFPPQGTIDQSRYWISRFTAPPRRQMSDADDLWFVSLELERLGIGQSFIAPSLYEDDDTFYHPTIIWDQLFSPSRITDPDMFYSPRIIFDQFATAALYADPDTFYSPQIALPTAVIISFAEVEANT